MDAYALDAVQNTAQLVHWVQRSNDPVLVFEGRSECLVAMRPTVFERLLRQSEGLSREARSLMHF